MNEPKKCPDCKEGWMKSEAGKLDQCGLTHLVTRTWECSACGRKEWEPARAATWQANPEATLEPQVVGNKP